MHTDKTASDLYGLVLFKRNLLQVKYLNPTDFEIKNILLQIGELGKFPQSMEDLFVASNDSKRLFNKVEALNQLLKRQKIGYFGSSQFGIFSMMICLSGFPFSEKENEGYLLRYIENQNMTHNDHRTVIKKLDKPEEVFQTQLSDLGNSGIGQNLVFMIFELPKGKLKANFELGQTVQQGQSLFSPAEPIKSKK